MSRAVLDIEANGLKPDTIWCIVFKEIDNDNRIHSLVGDSVNYLHDHLESNGITELVGHNLLGYDVPVLERLTDFDSSKYKITDTYVLSRLADPQREGGHGLDSWGKRLGKYKGDHNDWSKFSIEMLEYCKNDVEVNHLVYNQVCSELESFGHKAIDLEHRVQTIVTEQIENGWLLDEKKATLLLAELRDKQTELENNVHNTFKPLPKEGKEITPKIKKDGSLSIVGIKFLGDSWVDVSGPLCRVDWPVFNLGSRQQIAKHLQYYGWKPKKFTDKGNVIVDEKVLEEVKGIPEAKLIQEYLLVSKRIAQVQSWVEAIEDDGRVHGYVNTIGAVTGRMTHSSPNVAQTPASYSPYGMECRSCWTVPKGYKLVGADASGLELRMLAHYMNDEGYTNEILNGDIHTANQMAAGLESRDQAKTFIYAFLYGAGDAKIGAISGGSAKHGRKLKERFLDNTPALRDLRERVERACKKGYVRGLDERHIRILSPHKALNSLLQGAGAIVMKEALVIADEFARRNKIDFKWTGQIHDEMQCEVKEEHAERMGRLLVSSIRAAGKSFNMRIPLDGDYMVGDDWSQTH